mmetsp:Transcript_61893/g.109997  ORF Transcript_61893/g.109997 Transcript_61893/m.109997 type:complete len:443 (-) Transcript_61893:66-1394(-)
MVAVQAFATLAECDSRSMYVPQSGGLTQQYMMAMLVPIDQLQGNFAYSTGANDSVGACFPVCTQHAGPAQAPCESTKPEDLLAATTAADAAAGLEACLAHFMPMAYSVPVPMIGAQQMVPVPMKGCYAVQTASTSSGDSDSGQSREELPRVTASAARRLRRRRAAERGRDVVSLSTDRYEELKLKAETGHSELETLRGHVWALAQDAQGSRLLQMALDNADLCEATKLTAEFQGHVVEAATSPHANYVLQKILSQLPNGATSFIAEEILALPEDASKIARHRYGCRIFCRLLEFSCSQSQASALLVSHILEEAEDLCRHSFGHHVLQAALEHGNASHRRQVAAGLLSDVESCAKHRNGSYLVEKALTYCCEEDRSALLECLGKSSVLADLATSPYGSFVAKTALKFLESNEQQDALARLGEMANELRELRHGPQFLEEVGFG